MPEISGIVAQYLLDPRGRACGLMLDDGTDVHFPPHLSEAVCRATAIGEKASIQGIRPRGPYTMIAAIVIAGANGRRVVDNGPPPKAPKHDAQGNAEPARSEMTIEGTVRRILHGPKSEPRGLLFDDGRMVRFPSEALASAYPPC